MEVQERRNLKTQDRNWIKNKYGNKCMLCDSEGKLVIHHRDKHNTSDKEDNNKGG